VEEPPVEPPVVVEVELPVVEPPYDELPPVVDEPPVVEEPPVVVLEPQPVWPQPI